MLELNAALQAAVEGRTAPVEMIDPQTNVRYVLVRADDFERIRNLAYDDSPWTDEEKALLTAETGKRIGWDEMSEHDETSRQVRVAGRLDIGAGNTDGRFTLRLADGGEAAGIAKDVNLDGLAKLQGKQAVVSGRAIFDASGTLLRVEADRVTPARPADLNVFSKAPRPFNGKFDVEALRRPQGPHSGIAAIFGQWPGDETDEEIEAYLKEIS